MSTAIAVPNVRDAWITPNDLSHASNAAPLTTIVLVSVTVVSVGFFSPLPDSPFHLPALNTHEVLSVSQQNFAFFRVSPQYENILIEPKYHSVSYSGVSSVSEKKLKPVYIPSEDLSDWS
jgi:hypothetical protein